MSITVPSSSITNTQSKAAWSTALVRAKSGSSWAVVAAVTGVCAAYGRERAFSVHRRFGVRDPSALAGRVTGQQGRQLGARELGLGDETDDALLVRRLRDVDLVVRGDQHDAGRRGGFRKA